MFSFHITPEKLENATITGHFGFVFAKKLGQGRHRFQKAPLSKCCPSTQQRKAGVVKFLRFPERFPKAPFSCRINGDSRPNRRRNKAAFSNSSGVL